MRAPLFIAALTLALLAFSAAAGIIILSRTPSDPIAAAAQPFGHNTLRWEIEHLPGRWLSLIGDFLRQRDDDDPAILLRYFAAVNEADRLQPLVEAGNADARTSLAGIEEERLKLENRVERIIEERVATILKEQGLTISPPLFDGIDVLFPPIDIEFDGPPRILIISPRDRIRLEHTYLLRHDMTIDEVQRLEQEAEVTQFSALVDTTGGVATYPSTVRESASYGSALELAAHEWMHQHLFFYPLGRRYFHSEEMRTINETVANIAGREIARLARERFPLEEPTQPASPPRPGFDFGREIRQLRLAVDGLLAEGKIDEAEALMEQKRLFLAENGRYIRKINQAFFAFHGTYADTPSSSSPIGPKVEAVRERSASVGRFVDAMAQVASIQELDALLSRLGVYN